MLHFKDNSEPLQINYTFSLSRMVWVLLILNGFSDNSTFAAYHTNAGFCGCKCIFPLRHSNTLFWTGMWTVVLLL